MEVAKADTLLVEKISDVGAEKAASVLAELFGSIDCLSACEEGKEENPYEIDQQRNRDTRHIELNVDNQLI